MKIEIICLKAIALLISIFSVSILAGCAGPIVGGKFIGEYKETITKAIPAENVKLLKVSEVNGSVKVNFDEVKTVRMKATKIIRALTDEKAKGFANELVVKVESGTGTVDIHTEYPPRIGKLFVGWVNYEITAPAGMRVEAETTNGAIILGPGGGGGELDTTNGALTIDGVKSGHLKAETTNGGVKVTNSNVPMRVEATNGGVTVIDCAGTVDAEATNGKITYSSARPPMGDVSLKLVNGFIEAAVPTSSDLEIEASTVNGSVKTDLPVKEKTHSRKSLNGTLNKGTHKMRMETVNGGVRLEEKK